MRGNEDLNGLSEWEMQQFTLWCLNETGMWEMCYKLYKQGALDESLYHGKAKYWLQLHSSPGRREWWDMHAVLISTEFYNDISLQLENIPIKKLRETNPIFDSSIHDNNI